MVKKSKTVGTGQGPTLFSTGIASIDSLMSRQFQPVADTQVSKPLQVFSIFGVLFPF